MKYILTLFFALFGVSSFGQCSPSQTPQTVFAANSTYTYVNQQGPLYLCGPNTILWDTIGCYWNVYCNPSTTLNLRGSNCATLISVSMKNGSVLNVLQGSSPVMIYYEAGAIINDPFNLANSWMCQITITFPNVMSCSVGLKELKKEFVAFHTWPNPTGESINFEFFDLNNETVELSIYDQVGKVVFYKPSWQTSDKKLQTNFLDNGSYFLNIKTNSGQQTQKLVIIR